jgi:hypothetical protein
MTDKEQHYMAEIYQMRYCPLSLALSHQGEREFLGKRSFQEKFSPFGCGISAESSLASRLPAEA